MINKLPGCSLGVFGGARLYNTQSKAQDVQQSAAALVLQSSSFVEVEQLDGDPAARKSLRGIRSWGHYARIEDEVQKPDRLIAAWVDHLSSMIVERQTGELS